MAIQIQGLGEFGMSKQAKKFISREIKTLISKKHYAPKRAVAAAFSQARKKGYKVPKARAR